jgi:Asp-tRNA(Asn)/Glu-tRNA(Gln) amidotransferase A subunit family amidase
MWAHPAPLVTTAAALRSGQTDLIDAINESVDRIEIADPFVQALLPEAERRKRLLAEARALQERFPEPAQRPPLYGVLLGVKDVLRADSFPTRAGSRLPPDLFIGPEAACVSKLKGAGALILGKTVSAEFAYFEPGATRNPHNLEHTPGGSSSGSAAAVAAGFCPLALGTQTSGSVLRPAAFCGIIGFKPGYGRISTSGLIPCAVSLDHIGYFAQDVAGIALVAPLLIERWQTIEPPVRPVLGVPDGPYLAQASEEGLAAFETQIARLKDAGYTVRHIEVLENIEYINVRQIQIVLSEMAQVHSAWFAQYGMLYAPRTAQAIHAGQHIQEEELVAARTGQMTLRMTLRATMKQHGIDLWVCPAAPGGAPKGLTTTGNPNMNIPWTHAGLPALSLPAGQAANGLPLGLQFVGATMADEYLISWAKELAEALV